ncbi:MAG: hypothetical protein BGO69_05525 [Bacteroidetes bacterium 46-16]|nr:MAG: hypothetical protein BGO69_05525 [Bacteroidetes bacterium 46-16]
MKLIRDVFRTMRVLLCFGRQHAAALAMVNGTYMRQPARDELVIAGSETLLSIKPCGNLYEVLITNYVANQVADEQKWLATYGWHSNGHLIEIGGDRYCILDTASQSLYLETFTKEGATTVDLFIKNL